ncbi:MAG: glycerol-3-phosphate dehydrogenase, partial [Verrucomicrobiales bacterium]
MNRDQMLERARSAETWDVAIIGGGATGLACAWDAALRGHRTILIDKADFAKGTSSRTTKLIHGGVRYLKQGNVKLVREALRERSRLLRNAPDLVKPLPFVIPGFSWLEKIWYALGLRVYDLLTGFGKRICPRSKLLSRDAVGEALPGLKLDDVSGGVRYFDAQFDDSRLAVAFARSAAQQNGCVLNYVSAAGFEKSEDGRITGIEAVDELSGQQLLIRAKSVINATGVFADGIIRMDDPKAEPVIQPAQGVHLALDSRFLESDRHALMIPKTDDGRVIFVIPWHGRVLLGTTDTPRPDAEYEPRPLDEEIDYLLEHAARYLKTAPTRADVLSTWAGLRPLVRPRKGSGETKEISRSHSLF